MDLFDQGLPLGRWFKIRVILHWSFLLYAGFLIYQASPQERGYQIQYMVVLFGTVLLHEFGHALSCKAVGGKADRIILWPLGGIAFVQPPNKAWAHLIVVVCGPLVNAILWPTFWALSEYAVPSIAQRVDQGALWFTIFRDMCIQMQDINKLLLMFNLIPAYPMDGGQILQNLLWMTLGYRASLQISGMIGVAVGAGFVMVGLGLIKMRIPVIDIPLQGPNIILVMIGAMVAMNSLQIYFRSMEIGKWQKK